MISLSLSLSFSDRAMRQNGAPSDSREYPELKTGSKSILRDHGIQYKRSLTDGSSSFPLSAEFFAIPRLSDPTSVSSMTLRLLASELSAIWQSRVR